MTSKEQWQYAQMVKARYEAQLLRKRHVVGVGLGLQIVHGEYTDQPALVVNVTHKVPPEDLSPDDLIPRVLDGVAVRVEAVGELKVQG